MPSTKRKAQGQAANSPPSKKPAPSTDPTNNESTNNDNIRTAFRPDLFDSSTIDTFQGGYKTSGPYPHAVVPSLIEDQLLRNVRSEIKEHIHFTPKETDIYRIHQSGDLANLSALDAASLKHLPSLVRLRDALYSSDFRAWVSKVTGAGPLSGRKTDMAVNVYTPGSYLLCHDDVIGSRRVSYILYLTDPDDPWQAGWGGGLRLYPTESRKDSKGEEVKVPLPEYTKNIPPAFGQLSFFTVLPGESYHDVEEVYYGNNEDENKRRIRMAVSGWFHIPQEGEDGYEEGQEQALAQRSSLAQLKGVADEFDEPQHTFRHYDEPRLVPNSAADGLELDPGEGDSDDTILTEQDLTFLLQYIAPGFLVPDKLEELSESFQETSMLQLQSFLRDDFAKKLRQYIEDIESGKGEDVTNGDHPTTWSLARPPHKHRFAYLQQDRCLQEGGNPFSKLLIDLLHSHAFKKWLSLATALNPAGLVKQNSVARRFRRGHDYALASAYTGEQPQLEFTISMTPSSAGEPEPEAEKEVNGKGKGKATNGRTKANGHTKDDIMVEQSSVVEPGGEEVYMAGDDDDTASTHSKALPSVGKKAVHDPAVYQSGADGEEEDAILFSDSPTWNMFSVVLRDAGTMRFVKYISQAAKGDRWDVKGEIQLTEKAFEDDGDDIAAQDDDDDAIGEDDFSDPDQESDADPDISP